MTDAVNAAEETLPDANASSTEATEADAEVTKSESEAESSPAVKKADDDVTDKVRSRIDELTSLRRQAERDRDYWREEASRRQREVPEPKPQVVTQAKSLADFEYDESKYQAHLIDLAEQRASAAVERRFKEREQETSAARRLTEFKTKEAKFAASVDDYSEVAHFAPINNEVAQVVMELDAGPEVAYYLGKNPEIAAKLNELPAYRVGIELGRLEDKLVREREKAKEKLLTKTPPPAPKIDAAGDATTKVRADDPESDNKITSADEWAKQRNREILRKRK